MGNWCEGLGRRTGLPLHAAAERASALAAVAVPRVLLGWRRGVLGRRSRLIRQNEVIEATRSDERTYPRRVGFWRSGRHTEGLF